MANAPVPRTLTRAQQARRQRVIDAAMSLALDGGYEAVQMRDVAARADVAMGTVYRYFTSKDHLLAAALVHWVEQLDSRLAQSPAQGGTPAERVIDAAMSLALEGGYEAVQMRDVAARADVAMGTVYRYFTSKDHLLAAALVLLGPPPASSTVITVPVTTTTA